MIPKSRPINSISFLDFYYLHVYFFIYVGSYYVDTIKILVLSIEFRNSILFEDITSDSKKLGQSAIVNSKLIKSVTHLDIYNLLAIAYYVHTTVRAPS